MSHSTKPSDYFSPSAVDSTSEYAQTMDKNDPLKKFRFDFEIPKAVGSGATSIYLCGNSLGPLPKRARYYVNEELDKWSNIGVEGHWKGKRPWIKVDDTSQELMCEIVGAKNADEVAVMNGLTVNCHLMFVSFYRPTKQRYKIVMEGQAFCSDHHLVRSHIELHDLSIDDALIQLFPRENEEIIRTEDIFKCIEKHGSSIALIWLGAVQYYTGQFFEMEKITKKAHEYGITVGFDCAHAVGNVPLKLHDWDVDFATWCTYKYLNSGPGHIAGAFVHEKWNNKKLKRFSGWWGQTTDTKVNMHNSVHIPKPGAQAWRLSNPPVLPTVCLEASLEIFKEAGIQNLRAKSKCLTRYLELLLAKYVSEYVTVITPKDPEQRGCQLSLVFNVPMEKVHEMIENRGVVCDLRKPNVMRIAPNPLYNSFSDVWKFVAILKDCLASAQFQNSKL